MNFRFALLFAAVALAPVSPVQSAGTGSSRATVVLPAVACKTPEAYNEAALLTRQRTDAGSRPMLLDHFDRHGCVGLQTGETVTILKSGTFEGGRFVQLRRGPDTSRQDRRGPPIYWTVPEAIGQ
jgi:hypothetical protein